MSKIHEHGTGVSPEKAIAAELRAIADRWESEAKRDIFLSGPGNPGPATRKMDALELRELSNALVDRARGRRSYATRKARLSSLRIEAALA